jgi:hypothetical protein
VKCEHPFSTAATTARTATARSSHAKAIIVPTAAKATVAVHSGAAKSATLIAWNPSSASGTAFNTHNV